MKHNLVDNTSKILCYKTLIAIYKKKIKNKKVLELPLWRSHDQACKGINGIEKLKKRAYDDTTVTVNGLQCKCALETGSN